MIVWCSTWNMTVRQRVSELARTALTGGRVPVRFLHVEIADQFAPQTGFAAFE